MGRAGVAAVIIVSVFITVMLFISVRYTLLVQPEPTGIYKPQNILLLPGINEYVPSTLAVWLAFIITIAVHEFGHAILCRVENIKVKTMGVLVAVIPIGFFVEPDEEELDRTRGMAKIRMFGAGITNNLVVGFSCFILLILCMGLVVPVYPADHSWGIQRLSSCHCRNSSGIDSHRGERRSRHKPCGCFNYPEHHPTRNYSHPYRGKRFCQQGLPAHLIGMAGGYSGQGEWVYGS